MQNFQNTSETRKRSFISAFSAWIVPLISLRRSENVRDKKLKQTQLNLDASKSTHL